MRSGTGSSQEQRLKAGGSGLVMADIIRFRSMSDQGPILLCLVTGVSSYPEPVVIGGQFTEESTSMVTGVL